MNSCQAIKQLICSILTLVVLQLVLLC